jgi:hypothetical protein
VLTTTEQETTAKSGQQQAVDHKRKKKKKKRLTDPERNNEIGSLWRGIEAGETETERVGVIGDPP